MSWVSVASCERKLTTIPLWVMSPFRNRLTDFAKYEWEAEGGRQKEREINKCKYLSRIPQNPRHKQKLQPRKYGEN